MAYAALDKNGELVPTNQKVGFSNPRREWTTNLRPWNRFCNDGICKKQSPVDLVLDQMTFENKECRGKSKDECEIELRRMLSIQEGRRELAAPTGTLKNLVILMRFNDHTGRTLPSKGNIDTLMNTAGIDSTFAPTGSVKTFYQKATHGKLTIESTIVDWVTLPNTEAYYADGRSGYVRNG